MLGIIDIIKRSFKAWTSNFIIVLPFVFLYVAALILMIPLLAIIFFSFLKSYFSGITGMATDTALETFPTFPNFFGLTFLMNFILIYVVIFVVALLFISAYFSPGAIGMAKELWQKKISLRTMHEYGKYFYWRFLGVSILLALITIGIYAVLIGISSLPFFITRQPVWLLLLILGILIAFFLVLFFILAPLCLVAENLGIRRSISRSCQIVRKNYFSLLGLVILFMLMMGGAGMITNIIPFTGWIGSLASLLVFQPVLTIALMLFVLDRMQGKKLR